MRDYQVPRSANILSILGVGSSSFRTFHELGKGPWKRFNSRHVTSDTPAVCIAVARARAATTISTSKDSPIPDAQQLKASRCSVVNAVNPLGDPDLFSPMLSFVSVGLVVLKRWFISPA